jgi:exodeoxyribonuclease V alpha subunit
MVGDPNQLPPIGVGSLLNALIKCNLINRYHLTENKRIMNTSGDRNLIMVNALGMINNEPGEFFQFEAGSEFQPINSNDINVVESILLSLKGSGVPASDITIETPFNEHLLKLNKIFQKIYNTPVEYTTDSKGRVLLLNDRVTHNKNDYNLNIMNGDTGIIIQCDPKFVKVKFTDDAIFNFSTQIVNENTNDGSQEIVESDEKADPDVSHIDISFATTVHKMQGSENKYIIGWIPTDDKNKNFLDVNLLYTAFTRPRMGIYIVGDIAQISEGVRTRPKQRFDKLSERIIKLCPNVKPKIISVDEDDF